MIYALQVWAVCWGCTGTTSFIIMHLLLLLLLLLCAAHSQQPVSAELRMETHNVLVWILRTASGVGTANGC